MMPVPRTIPDLSPRKWLLVPIETKAREYHAKLLFSCVAAEAGFGVILGHMNHLNFNLPLLPRGIVFSNNIVRGKDSAFRAWRQMGYTVGAWCEEGVAYRNRASYRSERVSPEAMHQAAVFFAWGDYHAEDVRRAVAPGDRARVVPCGNPRLDLLRPGFREFFREAAEKIRSRYGRIVLVNTNFHRFNHFIGRGAYLRDLRERGSIPDAERERFFQGWIDFLGKMYGAFSRMLGALSRSLPDHTIVLRPHPSENHEAWRRDIAGLPGADADVRERIRVIHEGSVLPWILASDVVIHNSCATGIEAFAMDVPVVAYRPLTSKAYDGFLPNAVSRSVFSEPELVDQVKAIVDAPSVGRSHAAARRRKAAGRFFSGLDGGLASERMVDTLQGIQNPARPFAPNDLGALLRVAAVRGWLPVRAGLRRMLRGPNPLDRYIHQKFPSLPLAEVQNDIGRLSRVSDRFSRVAASEIGDMLFAITQVRRSPDVIDGRCRRGVGQ